MAEKNTRKNTRTGNKNLKPAPPWPKGQSGNPNGRPLGARDGVRARLRRLLDKEPSIDIIQAVQRLVLKANPTAAKVNIPKLPVAQLLAEILVVRALMSNKWSIEQILKQTEEPLKQTVEMEGALGIGTFAELVKFASSKGKE